MKANILAAKTVARTLRSSLGPKGMDKMLQSPDGDVTISEFSYKHLCSSTRSKPALYLLPVSDHSIGHLRPSGCQSAWGPDVHLSSCKKECLHTVHAEQEV